MVTEVTPPRSDSRPEHLGKVFEPENCCGVGIGYRADSITFESRQQEAFRACPNNCALSKVKNATTAPNRVRDRRLQINVASYIDQLTIRAQLRRLAPSIDLSEFVHVGLWLLQMERNLQTHEASYPAHEHGAVHRFCVPER
jgi:hypothetical protein